jgi:hypothetical protein
MARRKGRNGLRFNHEKTTSGSSVHVGAGKFTNKQSDVGK